MRAFIRELIETVILALVIFLGLQFSVQPYRVEGPSMMPTLEEGQYILANKLIYQTLLPRGLRNLVGRGGDDGPYVFRPPHRGDVIVFRSPLNLERNFVKRVVAVPGDRLEIRRGIVFVNGDVQNEPYVHFPDSRSIPPVVIPEDSYFVLGDNRRSSDDSRNWGPVPVENIIGRAWVSYWPIDKWSALSIYH